MTKSNYFVVGDVHGCFDQLVALLNHHDPKTEQLVFIGDYVDRGPKSKQVLDLVMAKHADGAWCLKGNHEQLLENAIDNLSSPDFSHTDFQLWTLNGGKATIDSFRNPEYVTWFTHADVYAMLSPYRPFLESLHHYKETEHMIFVHAGVDPFASDWRTEKGDMLWIRDFFHHSPNATH